MAKLTILSVAFLVVSAIADSDHEQVDKLASTATPTAITVTPIVSTATPIANNASPPVSTDKTIDKISLAPTSDDVTDQQPITDQINQSETDPIDVFPHQKPTTDKSAQSTIANSTVATQQSTVTTQPTKAITTATTDKSTAETTRATSTTPTIQPTYIIQTAQAVKATTDNPDTMIIGIVSGFSLSCLAIFLMVLWCHVACRSQPESLP